MSTKITPAELAEVLGEVVVSDTGVASFADEKAYEKGLEKLGTNRDEIIKTQKAMASLANGISHAVGEAAVEYMAKHKKTESVTFADKVGYEKIDVEIKRTADIRSPTTGEVKKVNGALTLRRTQKYGGSETKGIKEHIRAIGANKLG